MTLAEWMDKKGLNDRELADLLGGKLSRSQINRIRNGRRTTPEKAKELERVTTIPAAKFVMGEAA